MGTAAAPTAEAKPVPSPVQRVQKPDSQKTFKDWADDQSMFAGLHPLPSNWIRVKSKSNTIYYANLVTGQTSLQEPASVPAHHSLVAPAARPNIPPPMPQDLPPGWEALKSRST